MYTAVEMNDVHLLTLCALAFKGSNKVAGTVSIPTLHPWRLALLCAALAPCPAIPSSLVIQRFVRPGVGGLATLTLLLSVFVTSEILALKRATLMGSPQVAFKVDAFRDASCARSHDPFLFCGKIAAQRHQVHTERNCLPEYVL